MTSVTRWTFLEDSAAAFLSVGVLRHTPSAHAQSRSIMQETLRFGAITFLASNGGIAGLIEPAVSFRILPSNCRFGHGPHWNLRSMAMFSTCINYEAAPGWFHVNGVNHERWSAELALREKTSPLYTKPPSCTPTHTSQMV